MSHPANLSVPAMPTESQPIADVGSSEGDVQLAQDTEEIISSQQHTHQSQSSEVVTSSSGSANTSAQQIPGETSSSAAQAPQQIHVGRGSTTAGSQRRGIQRQPIVWDAASSRSQGTPPGPSMPVRGMHGTRPMRGAPRSRRVARGIPTRGMFGTARRAPRGGP